MLNRIIGSVVLAASLLVFFNNCSPGFQVSESGSNLGSLFQADNEPWPEVNCSVANLSKAKLASEEEESVKQRFPDELKSLLLTEDDNLLVTVDNECFQSKGAQSLLTQALTELTPDAAMTTYRYPIFEETMGLEIYREMLNDNCIVEVDQDEQIALFNSPPTDPGYSTQRYLAAINHSTAFAQGYNVNNGINQDIRVAIIDSGVDTNHPDLRDMILRQNNQVVGLNGVSPSSTDYSDSGFHGTHVAGIVGAQAHNNQGISGTAGLNVKLMPVKTSNDGNSISASAVTNGLRWAADNGARVINMSLGGNTRVQAWIEAIRYANEKGAFVVIAAGNDGCEVTRPCTYTRGGQTIRTNSYEVYPAMFSTEATGVVTVGSSDVGTRNRSGFSNFSNQYVDIFAPGSDGANGILSTVPIRDSASGYSAGEGGRPINGTSMAAPVVAGAAAMVIGLAESRGFSITPDQVKYFFEKGSVENSSYSTFAIRGKVLDLKRLLDLVASDTGLPISSSLPRSQAAGVVELATHSKSLGLASGSALELQVQKTANSAVLVKYEWYKDGKILPGETKPVLRIANTGLRDKGVYQARLSSGRTQKFTSPIKVNIANCN